MGVRVKEDNLRRVKKNVASSRTSSVLLKFEGG
jgi:hypothetical protein